MTRSRAGIALVAVVLAGCSTASPVTLADLRPGEAVRTVDRAGIAQSSGVGNAGLEGMAASTRVYSLVRQVNGSIEVTSADEPTPFRIHLVDLERLEVVRGRDTPRAAMVGAGAGILAGVVVGMICRSVCGDGSENGRYNAPLTGLAIGVPVGALIGALLAPGRWVEVRLR